MKKALVATVVVFIVWGVMDFIIHGMILQSAYASTPTLWRPQAEIRMPTLYLSVLIGALAFCVIYSTLIKPKSALNALQFGLWYGIASGIGMGYGTYAVQPIPYMMALTWFLGTTAEAVVGGLIVGAMIKE